MQLLKITLSGVGGGRSGESLFWSVKGSVGVLDALEARDFDAAGLSSCGFSALCAALPHGLVEDELIDLVGGHSRERALLALCVVAGVLFFCFGGALEISRMVVSKCM